MAFFKTGNSPIISTSETPEDLITKEIAEEEKEVTPEVKEEGVSNDK